MHLENIVVDALEPGRLGRFWERALGATTLTDNEEGYETRLDLPGGGFLDLCFQPVPQRLAEPVRLHLDLRGGQRQREIVERLRGLGAHDLDIGQGEVPWIVLGDVEGNPFCVMEQRDGYRGTGPIAALPLDSADPGRDAEFWSWLTGWKDVPGDAPRTLRHPSGTGPLLELCLEPQPKGAGKNRMHLDVRLDPGDDAQEAADGIIERGGRELDPGWGELPWRVFTDPSGNELCILPAASAD